MFCHATPRDDNEMILVDSPIRRYEDAFAGLAGLARPAAEAGPAPGTIVVGHTHMPFDRLVDRRRVVNPGSVGMPYGHAGAAWALLGPDVVLRRARYDSRAAAAVLTRSAMPGIEEFIAENVLQVPSDAEALAVFTKVGEERRAGG
jgi:diadenosine tetraphosphatase ApaH/serine/threonine PP2A family protein phosphatase